MKKDIMFVLNCYKGVCCEECKIKALYQKIYFMGRIVFLCYRRRYVV